MAKLHPVGSELYKQLESETGQATGWHGCGAELTTEISLVEADMLRFARKGSGYIGAEVVEQKHRDGVDIRLVHSR